MYRTSMAWLTTNTRLKFTRFLFQVRRAISALLIILFQSHGYASETLFIDGSTGVKPLVEALAKAYLKDNSGRRIEIGAGLKPEARLQSLLDNKIQIAMASHGIDIQQITKLDLKVHRIAKMAVVIGANQSVNVGVISDQQLCDIYSGKITTWRDLGGSDNVITPFIRPYDEVDMEVLLAHIPCFSVIKLTNDIPIMAKSGQMAKALAKTHSAIGMTTLVRVAQSHGKIKALAFNDVTPDSANLINGAYPLSRDSFLITAARPSVEVEAFMAFVFSEKGEAIILMNSAVPVRELKGT